ncbi:MAG: ATP-binding protein [Candidatus Stygibacter frigidus]|nr:ATP-binding protein [Candidatus Stygibacter frigidus]
MNNEQLLAEAREIRNQSPAKALDILNRIDLSQYPDAHQKISIYRECIFNLVHMGKMELANQYIDKIKIILPETKDRADHIYYHKVSGIIHVEKGDFSTGIDEFMKVLDLAHKHNDMRILFDETINIGVLFHNLKKDDQALKYFMQARKIAEANNFNQADLMLNMIAANAAVGNIDEALTIGLELEKEYDNGDNLIHKISCSINIGDAFSKKQEYDKAIIYFEKAISLIKDTEWENRYSDVNYQLAAALERLGKAAEAIPYLDYALLIAKEQEKLSDQEKILRSLASCYDLTGDSKLAYDTLKKSYEIHESIMDETTNEKIAQYQATLEVQGKLNEKEQLMMVYARQAEMGQMIAAIAHQWRQPLNGLSIIFDSIYDAWEFDELDDESLQTKIASGKEIIFSMNNTIKDFRSFFQEKQEYDIFNVREVIEKSLRFTDYRFINEHIKLDFKIKDNCLLSGSSNQLLQVILIILNNAFDAFAGKAKKAAYVSIFHEVKDNYSCLRISDNAGGIKPELIDQIFALNFSTKSTDENSGIGLYLAKMIIEHKFLGSISVANSNNGAVFIIKIPYIKE